MLAKKLRGGPQTHQSRPLCRLTYISIVHKLYRFENFLMEGRMLLQPDAGAPIVVEDVLWGITSGWVSAECKLKPSPTVITRVSAAPVRLWIDSQLAS